MNYPTLKRKEQCLPAFFKKEDLGKSHLQTLLKHPLTLHPDFPAPH